VKICEDLWRSVKCKVRVVQHVQLQPLLRILINISNWSGLVRASDSKLPSQRTLDWNWIARSCSLNILFPLRICTYDRSETSPKQGTLPQWAKHSKTMQNYVSWCFMAVSRLLMASPSFRLVNRFVMSAVNLESERSSCSASPNSWCDPKDGPPARPHTAPTHCHYRCRYKAATTNNLHMILQFDRQW
jgi:hypothetical protein